jgi:hypothetical protein
MSLRSRILRMAAWSVFGALAACANLGTTTSDSAHLDIQATSHSIYEGEIVTVTTRSVNTLGADADIDWSTSGGNLDVEKNGRVARVKFDQPGTYMITAKLTVDGRVVDTDHVEVKVRNLTTDDDHDGDND